MYFKDFSASDLAQITVLIKNEFWAKEWLTFEFSSFLIYKGVLAYFAV